MRFFDLHCDTLYKATIDESDFENNDYHISVDKSKCIDNYKQMFAIWIPDDIKKENATKLFSRASDVFKNNLKYNSEIQMMLAVENASMLNGDLKNINLLVDNKVRYVTLTWNGDNELGSGAHSVSNEGITDFGVKVVKELEKNGIVIDVSHASDSLFYDVVKISTKPFIATHSNSRTITDVKRNLTDDQFKIIRDRKGIVGLNFYKGFLNIDEKKASVDDLIRHTEHFLNLGGENVLAIGSDFDGADMPDDISGVNDIPVVFEKFVSEFGANIADKIFYENADKFFTNFDNISIL